MSYPVGTRVLALRNSEAGKYYAFGFGIYEGDFYYKDVTSVVPPSELERLEKLKTVDKTQNPSVEEVLRFIVNPRIKLENGKYVWGCECWWSPADNVPQDVIDNLVIVELE